MWSSRGCPDGLIFVDRILGQPYNRRTKIRIFRAQIPNVLPALIWRISGG
jgi:hypothetical protein